IKSAGDISEHLAQAFSHDAIEGHFEIEIRRLFDARVPGMEVEITSPKAIMEASTWFIGHFVQTGIPMWMDDMGPPATDLWNLKN
ncbi:hypothetical protein AO826_20915, partial [Xanthomonas phaseoli pv. manihotis]